MNWGVLALNFDKSEYLPEEEAFLSMAVLDEKGQMVCDAALEIAVFRETAAGNAEPIARFSSRQETIRRNRECYIKDYTEKPDFEASYVFKHAGNYVVQLTAVTKNGSRSLSRRVKVVRERPFELRRQGPTRIFPMAEYAMTLEIKADRDIECEIEERVPEGFLVSEVPQTSRVVTLGNGKKQVRMSLGHVGFSSLEKEGNSFKLPVSLKKGESTVIRYNFKAPSLSPALFEMGPLRLVKKGKAAYEEPRTWLIASDESTTERPDADGTASGTWTYSTGSSYWERIDEDPDDADDGEYVQGPNKADGTLWLRLSDVPSDFQNATAVEIRVEHREAGSGDDRVALEYTIVDGDNSATEITAQTGFLDMADDGGSYELDVATPAITGTNTQASWNGAYLRIFHDYTKNGGPDGSSQGEIGAVEINITYDKNYEDYGAEWSDSTYLLLNTSASGANIATTQTNFPVLIRLNENNFDFSEAESDGSDLRFSTSSGTHCFFEIDRWDTSVDSAEIWVRVPSIAGNNRDQYIVMWWGNSSARDSSNGSAVFDSNDGFVGVWHLDEEVSGTGSSDTYQDATDNAYHGDDNVSAEGQTGVIGKGQEFDGDNDNIYTGTYDPSTTAVTLSAWVYWQGDDNSNQNVLAKRDAWDTGNNRWQFYYDDWANAMSAYTEPSGLVDFGVAPTQSDWTHLAVTYQNGTANGSKLYVNGTQVGGDKTYTWDSNTGAGVRIGGSDGSSTESWNGYIDEARISSSIRSADWIKLCYENQKTSQTLVDYDQYSDWTYNQTITLNTTSSGAGISGDVADFPLLLRLNSVNFDFSQAQGSGQDMRFANSDGDHLGYEIERWDSAGNTAEIWVRLDEVLGDNSTQYFTMYWGKSNASSKSNPAAVFDTAKGFAGVWHLKEEGNSDADGYADATGNGNHGQGVNMDNTDDVDAVVGKGQQFDGSSEYIQANDIQVHNDNTAYTVSAWVKGASGQTDKRFYSEGASTGGFPFFTLGTDNGGATGKLEVYIRDDDGTARLEHAASTADVFDNSWHYIAWVDNNGSYTFYVDGNASGSGSYTKNTKTLDRTAFGATLRSSAEFYLNGSIDEMRTSSTNRSADWIKLCYETQRTNQVTTSLITATSDPEDYEKAARFTFNTTSSGGGAGVTGDVTEIPMLLRMGSGDVDFSVTQDAGGDILFIDSSGENLYHEVVLWDKANDTALVWVKVPRVDGNSDDDYITMYYGCGGCSNGYARSTRVFSGYKAVWHLGAPDAMASDRTESGHDGAYSQSMPFNSGVTTEFAHYLDGSDNYIDAGDIADVDGAEALTVSGWVKSADLNDDGVILAKDVLGSNSQIVLYRDESGTSRNNTFAVTVSDGTNDASVEGANGALNDENWHYVAVTFTASNGTGLKLFVDGTEDANSGASTTSISTLKSTANSLQLGKPITTASKEWTGQFNEFRIATAVRSADYIKLSYENQKSAQTMINSDGVTGPVPVSGLQLWLKADAGVKNAAASAASDNDAVATWEDQSGNSRNVTQGTSDNRPLYQSDVSSTINGLPVVNFDGSNDFLLNNSYNWEESAFTLFVVGRSEATGANRSLASTSVNGCYSAGITSTDKVGVGVEGGSHESSNLSVSANRSYLFVYKSAGGTTDITTTVYSDGTQASSTLNRTDFTDGDEFMLGAADDASPTQAWDGDIGEVLLYGSQLGTADREMVENYLMERWSLGPPQNNATLSGAQVSGGVALTWTTPVSIDSRVDTVGIWVRNDAYPDSSRNGMLVGYFSTDESAYTWPATTTTTYYFTLLTRDSSGVWSDTASGAQTSLSFSGNSVGSSAKKITMNTTAAGVTGDETDFPLLVRLTDASFFTASTEDGRDIRFLDSNATDTLFYEIERWDSDNNAAEVWVRVPKVHGSRNDQFILMLYGDNSLTSASLPESVFTTSKGFGGVWHMGESSGASLDATKNSNDGTKDLGTAQSGAVGLSQSLDGTQFDSIPDHSTIQLGTSDFAISGWAKSTSVSNKGTVLSKGTAWTGGKRAILAFKSDGATEVNTDDDSNTKGITSAATTYLDGNWHLIYGVRDSDVLRLYMDGTVETTTQDMSSMGSLDVADRGLTIGTLISEQDNSSNEMWMNGNIDEVRLSTAARSADWIKLCYETQKPGATFNTLSDTTLDASGMVYVDSALGDDGNSCGAAGSPGSPKRTVASAADCSPPSGMDTLKILVMPGTYTDSAVSNGSHHVMVKGFDPNHPPVFNGRLVANTATLDISSKVHLRNIAVKANTNNDKAVNIEGNESEISIIGCRIYDKDGSTGHQYGIYINNAGSNQILIANNAINSASAAGIYTTATTNINIVHNVVYGYSTDGIKLATDGLSGVSVTNNVIYYTDEGIDEADTDNSGFLISNNLYHNVVTQVAGGASNANAVTGDPLFVSTDVTSSNAYKLSPGSPALDAATASLSSWATTTGEDYWSTSRPVGSARDIGLYEGTGYSQTVSGEFDSLIIDSNSDTISVRNANWKIVFRKSQGGGIADFYDGSDTTSDLLNSANVLFDVDMNGTALSSKTTFGPTLVADNCVHAEVKQQVDLSASLRVTVYYHIYASGHIFIQSAVEDLGGSGVADQTLKYVATLNNASDGGYHNGGANDGFGYLAMTNNRDLYLGVTENLDQPAGASVDFALDTNLSTVDSLVWATTDIDLSANMDYHHHFLLYIGSENMTADLGANIYAGTYNPSALELSAGSHWGKLSWQDSLRLQLPLDEAAGDSVWDVSGYGHHGVKSGDSEYWISGKDGGGLLLDVGDKVDLGDFDDGEAGSNRTYMLWVYVAGGGGANGWDGNNQDEATLLSKGTGGDLAIKKTTVENKIEFRVGNNAAVDLEDWALDQWNHVAGVIRGSSQIELYVNAVMRSVHATVSINTNASSLILGDNGGGSSDFEGKVDDLRIYHKACSMEEIQAVYNEGFAQKSGFYKLRANNNNRLAMVMNSGQAATRFQPALQIDNWYGAETPKYVYVDGTQLSPYTDFLSALEVNAGGGNRLEIQFNKTFDNADVDILIDDDDSTGFLGTTAKMPRLVVTHSGNLIKVRNLSDTVFGDRGDNEWELIVDRTASNAAANGDGGIYSWRSSEVSPNTAISSATDLTGSDSITVDQFRLDNAGFSGTAAASATVGYTIKDSSLTRLKLEVGSASFSGGTPTFDLTRTFTFYPTGRVFISHKITTISAQPTTPQLSIEGLNGISTSADAFISSYVNANGRAGKISDDDTDTTFRAFGLAVLSVATVEAGDTVTGATAVTGNGNAGTAMKLNFNNTYFENTDEPIFINYMIDFTKDYSDSASLDSVLSDVQDVSTLTALTGTAVTDDPMDFNGDGYAEGEGAYTYQAASGIAEFKMDISPARYYPAFKISNWNTSALPEMVFVDNQEQIRDYQYNASVDATNKALILHFNRVFVPTATKTTITVYVGLKTGLAVTLTEFRAIPGVGADTLRWITESEVDNLGFYLVRRIKPCYQSETRNIQYRTRKSQILNKSQSAFGGNPDIPRESGESDDGAALPNLEIGNSMLDIGTSAQPPSAFGGIHNIPRTNSKFHKSAALPNLEIGHSLFGQASPTSPVVAFAPRVLDIGTSAQPPYDASRWTPSRDSLSAAPPYILPEHCIDSEPLVITGLAKLHGGAAVFDTSWKRVNPRLIPGPEDGRSGSTRKYQFVDRTARFGVTYQYFLVSVDFNGVEQRFGPVEATPINPLTTRLYQNAPNPFNPSTSIRFDLKEKAPVTLNIYNVKGRLIRRLVTADKPLLPGKYRYIWDARDDKGRQVASGHYIYFFTSKNYRKARKMTLIK